MGTRGYYAFKYKGVYYVIYNHYDSYIEGMGKWIVDQLRAENGNFDDWIALLETIKTYPEDELLTPTPEIIESFRTAITSSETVLNHYIDQVFYLEERIFPQGDVDAIWNDQTITAEEKRYLMKGGAAKKKLKASLLKEPGSYDFADFVINTLVKQCGLERTWYIFSKVCDPRYLKCALMTQHLYVARPVSDEEPNCSLFIEYVYIIDFDESKFTIKSSHFLPRFEWDLCQIPENWFDEVSVKLKSKSNSEE